MHERGKYHVNVSIKQKRKLTNEEKIEIANKYLKGGVKVIELAKEYQCSHSSVCSYISNVKKGNIIMANRGGNIRNGKKVLQVDQEVKIKIAHEYMKGGINQIELAKKYGCSAGSVHSYINCVKNNKPMHLLYGNRK
jgi:transposase-like protein